jgi:hypothetical protein
LVLALVGCQRDSGFYDESAKAEARRAAREKLDVPGKIVSIGSAKERSKCPQAPSLRAGPCLNVEVKTKSDARPVGGGPSGGTLRMTLDAFIWLAKRGGRWKVTHTTWRPEDVSFNGVPYSPSK